jgi:hypothetical protein
MAKSEHGKHRKKNGETVFLFPESCSLGVVESSFEDVLTPVRFSVIDLSMHSFSEKNLNDVIKSLRMTHSVRVTQIPQVTKESEETEKNSLVVSFHEENESKQDWENPLVAAVVAIGHQPDHLEMTAFNEHIVKLESLGLTVNFGEDLSIVMLLDLLAVGSTLFYEDTAMIGNYFFKPVHYAEFLPALSRTVEPLIYALNHRRKTKPSFMHENSINLTGLLPDAFA